MSWVDAARKSVEKKGFSIRVRRPALCRLDSSRRWLWGRPTGASEHVPWNILLRAPATRKPRVVTDERRQIVLGEPPLPNINKRTEPCQLYTSTHEIKKKREVNPKNRFFARCSLCEVRSGIVCGRAPVSLANPVRGNLQARMTDQTPVISRLILLR